jgi:hypothetical protein
MDTVPAGHKAEAPADKVLDGDCIGSARRSFPNGNSGPEQTGRRKKGLDTPCSIHFLRWYDMGSSVNVSGAGNRGQGAFNPPLLLRQYGMPQPHPQEKIPHLPLCLGFLSGSVAVILIPLGSVEEDAATLSFGKSIKCV